MPGSPARIVQTPEFEKSLEKIERMFPRPQYASVVEALAREVTLLSDNHTVLPRLDIGYPEDPETKVHALVPGFVLTYGYLPESESAPARILLKPVLPV